MEKQNACAEIEHMRRVGRLVSDIAGVIEGGDYTYKEAMQAMDDLRNHYEKQSRNLADGVSIQKVATFGGVATPNDIVSDEFETFSIRRTDHEVILRDFIEEILKARQERIAKTGSSRYTEYEVFMTHLASILLPDEKCRVVMDYDPAKEKICFF